MEDRQIVQLFWDRDEQAIRAAKEKYESACMHIARNILRNDQDVQECLSDTYQHTWNAIPPQRPAHLGAFMCRIARNLALDRYRRSAAQKRGGGQLPLVLDELGECIAGSDDVPQRLAYRELVEAIEAFVCTLGERNRRLFIRRYWYTDSISQIAQQMHMTQASASMALRRIRKKLRDYLSQRGF